MIERRISGNHRQASKEIWKETSRKFRLQLRLLYVELRQKLEDGNSGISRRLLSADGIIVDPGGPRESALLLERDGSIKFVQYGDWAPPPDRDLHEITPEYYCVLATWIIKESTR